MSIELVNIVNEKDEVIGQKSRDELTADDIIRIAVLWIENSKDEVLLQQRSFNKKIGPGQWGPAAAGTVEAHETYLLNIIKEAEEEIGLVGFIPERVGKRLHRTEDGLFGRMFTFFKASVDKELNEFTIQENEVSQIKWAPKQTLLQDVRANKEQYVPSAIFWDEVYY